MKCACFKANKRCNSRCHNKGNNPNCRNHDELLDIDRADLVEVWLTDLGVSESVLGFLLQYETEDHTFVAFTLCHDISPTG